MFSDEDLFDPRGAGAYLGGSKPLASSTMAKYRTYGTGPTYLKLPNGLIRYRRSDLDAWLGKSKRASSTSEAA